MKTKLIAFALPFSLLLFQSCTKTSDVVKSVSSTSTEDAVTISTLTDSSLICYLPFSGNFKDKSGHRNNGTPFGSPSFVSDRFGNNSKAVSFSLSNSWIEIPQTQLNGLQVYSISMDFYVKSSSHQCLMSKMSYSQPYGTSGWYQSVALFADPSIATPLQFNNKPAGLCSADQWNSGLNSAVVYNLNQWNYLTVTVDNTIAKMYLNGVLVTSSAIQPSPICGDEPIRLGVWWQIDPNYFTGYMDEFRIYKRVLSAKEVKKLSTL